MNKGRFQILSSVVLATCFGVAANGCGGGDDDNGGSSATGGSAGKGSGGKAGASGAAGASAKGGSSGAGGSVATGGAGTGGTSGAGATSGGTGGTVATGGVGASAGTGGTNAQGGMGGISAGGTGGMPSYCYEDLYAPISMPNDQVDFEIDYGDTTPIDLSATTLSVRLRAETAGNGGGVQVYVKNGSAQNYAAAYLGWNNLTDLTNFTVISKAVADLTGGTGFDPTKIRYVGVNINAGDTFDGADFEPATVYVDSITFSDGASADLDFNDGVPRLAVNMYNNPVAGAAVSAGICQEETGTGGMGGMSGSAGTAGTSASGGSGGSGAEAGAAGLGGEGGFAGADLGTGGTNTAGTGGGAGSGGTSSGGTSSGGTSSGGASSGGAGNGGVSGSGTAGASGHAGAGGTGTSANLIVNGTFESGDTNGWTTWGTGTLAVTTTNPHSGNDALAVTGRSGSNTNILQNITSVVSLGHTYTLSAWVRTSAATTGHFTRQVDCASASENDDFAWVQQPVNLSTGWTQITGTVDLSQTSYCTSAISAINLYFEGPGDGVDVYLDDVTMTQD